MPLAAEVAAAAGALTLARRPGAGAPEAVRAAALAWYPAVGLGVGAASAAVAVLAARVAPALAGPAGVLAAVALTGGQGARDVARAARASPAAALVPVVLRAAAASALPGAARTLGLAVAPMLGAWAVVVQCHGGMPVRGSLVGRARFREFGWASLTAFAVTLGLGDALGLVLLLAAAATTLGVRVVAHRAAGGLAPAVPGATRELVETAVVAVLAAVVRATRAGGG
jgi:small basic protein